jgi:hypothetical protein
MQIYRLSAVLNNESVTPIIITFPTPEPWLFICEDGPLHFFFHPSTGHILTIEFTDDGLEVGFPTSYSCHTGIPLLEGKCLHLSAFSLFGSIFTISAKTGHFLTRTIADLDDDSISVSSDSPPFTPPNRIWTLSQVSTSSIEVLGGGDSNCSVVLSHSRFLIAEGGASLRIRSTDRRLQNGSK